MTEDKDKREHRYDDIIDRPHPTSKVHPRMQVSDRAAQFSPFAALTGHNEAIKETARLTDAKPELEEDAKAELDAGLRRIRENPDAEQPVTFTYFVPDEKKAGGEYREYTGIVKRFDEYEHTVIMRDKTVIPIDQIYEIKLYSEKNN